MDLCFFRLDSAVWLSPSPSQDQKTRSPHFCSDLPFAVSLAFRSECRAEIQSSRRPEASEHASVFTREEVHARTEGNGLPHRFVLTSLPNIGLLAAAMGIEFVDVSVRRPNQAHSPGCVHIPPFLPNPEGLSVPDRGQDTIRSFSCIFAGGEAPAIHRHSSRQPLAGPVQLLAGH